MSLVDLMQTGAPVGTVKLLRNTESLASLCVAAGLSIKDAEALKGLFPALMPRALVHALSVASGKGMDGLSVAVGERIPTQYGHNVLCKRR
jgi:hypothetical protein